MLLIELVFLLIVKLRFLVVCLVDFTLLGFDWKFLGCVNCLVSGCFNMSVCGCGLVWLMWLVSLCLILALSGFVGGVLFVFDVLFDLCFDCFVVSLRLCL